MSLVSSVQVIVKPVPILLCFSKKKFKHILDSFVELNSFFIIDYRIIFIYHVNLLNDK